MSDNVSADNIAELIREALEKNGEVSFTAIGRSMLPIIRDKKDIITLVKPPRHIKSDDVVLYIRENGQCVLSRVMFVNGSTFVLRGDNQWDNEYNVEKGRIIGTLKAFERNGKAHNTTDRSYQIYVKLLPLVRFLRKNYYSLKSQVYKFLKYLLKR